MEKTLKAVNYTAEQTSAMVADYKAGMTAADIALKMGKGMRSVIAKLSREKVYVKAVKTAKNGEAVVHKDELADNIGTMLMLTEAETTGLAKTPKTALKKILEALETVSAVA